MVPENPQGPASGYGSPADLSDAASHLTSNHGWFSSRLTKRCPTMPVAPRMPTSSFFITASRGSAELFSNSARLATVSVQSSASRSAPGGRSPPLIPAPSTPERDDSRDRRRAPSPTYERIRGPCEPPRSNPAPGATVVPNGSDSGGPL